MQREMEIIATLPMALCIYNIPLITNRKQLYKLRSSQVRLSREHIV